MFEVEGEATTQRSRTFELVVEQNMYVCFVCFRTQGKKFSRLSVGRVEHNYSLS
jgi:hypothetical protein